MMVAVMERATKLLQVYIIHIKSEKQEQTVVLNSSLLQRLVCQFIS